jgi:hypothetical protein
MTQNRHEEEPRFRPGVFICWIVRLYRKTRRRRPDLHQASRITSAVGSWSEPAHYVGEHFGNVAGLLMSVLCPWRGRLFHDVRLRRGGIWQHSRDVQLLYYARLEPLGFSG